MIPVILRSESSNLFWETHCLKKVNLAYEAERDEKILRLRENGNKMRTVPFA